MRNAFHKLKVSIGHININLSNMNNDLELYLQKESKMKV